MPVSENCCYFSPYGNEDPADVPAIKGGRKYYTDVYKNDSNSDNVKNSCDQSSSSDSSNSPTSGGGGTGWSSGFTFLGSGCIGSCSTPNITITDLPDQEDVNDN